MLSLAIIARPSFAQDFNSLQSNFRTKKISTKNKTVYIDTLSVIPNSFVINGLSDRLYSFNPVNSLLIWNDIPLTDSVTITYRVFSIKLNSVSNHLKFDEVKDDFLYRKKSQEDSYNNPLIDFGTLKTTGSIGRSIILGTNQDAVVNSSMNLQLTGYLTDSLELTAVLNDNNTPVQPDGNTQSLSDFDKIFIELKKRSWKLQLGDIDLQQKNLSYMQFSKRLQGISFNTDNIISKHISNNAIICGAISKGKYTKNLIKQIDGNQGPYKLQGANNELYFIVLSGSEKVYIDGELLQRGQDQDYTIDYNTAEITFTSKRIISKDFRIQVEFEYSDRSYLNTQLYFNDDINFHDKLSINIGTFVNYDDKNATIDLKLDDRQKKFLSDIGDSIQNAYITNASIDTLTTGKFLYKKQDTVVLNQLYNIFIQSNNKNDTLYNVSFSYVGNGNGNYIQKNSSVNGKIFEWVAPGNNNEKNGEWEPISFITTPKKQQVYTIAAKYLMNKHTAFLSEFALSDYDKNLFASKDKSDNQGIAEKFTLKKKSPNFKFLKNEHRLESSCSYEYISKTFQPIERLNSIEFYRDWNLNYNPSRSNENTIAAMVQLIGEKEGFVKYELTKYHRDEGFDGIKHSISQKSIYKSWLFANSIDITNTSSAYSNGYFFRPSFECNRVFKKLNFIMIGARYHRDMNELYINHSTQLSYQSFAFDNIDFFFKTDQQKFNKLNLSYSARVNYLPYVDKLVKSDNSQTYTLNFEILSNENHQIKSITSYRRLQNLQKKLSIQNDEESILGRFEYNFNLLEGFINGNFVYESGGGQDQKRQYNYIEVPSGQGVYDWNDYNGNGVQELNEFELAVFQDQKKYIRVYSPTNEYIKTNNLQLNYALDIKPSYIIKNNSKRFLKIIRNTSMMSMLQYARNEIANNNILANPFSFNSSDSSLVSVNASFSNIIYYNRNDPQWSFDITHTQIFLKSFLSYGMEEKKVMNFTSKFRFSIIKQLVSNITYRNNSIVLSNTGDNFSNRNYYIKENVFEPNITYLYHNKFRMSMSYIYAEKRNVVDLMEKSESNSFVSDFKYSVFSNTSLNLKFTLNKTTFVSTNSNINSSIAYALLNGLVPGQNALWSIDFTQRLYNNIEINLLYEGRKPGLGETVNTGRATIRAIF